MGSLVWIVVGILAVNALAVGWLLTLELVERHRLNKEIKQVDALWRYLTTPLSATVAWRVRGGIGGRRRLATAGGSWGERPLGRAPIAIAMAATIVWVAAAAFGPAPHRTVIAASDAATGFVSPELEMRRNGGSPTPVETTSGGRVTPQSPSGVAPNISIATSDDVTVPATVAAQPHSSTAVSIRWAEVPVAIGYAVERKKDTKPVWLKVATTEEDVTAYTDVGLEADTTYLYRVSALTGDGTSAPSQVVSVKTPVAVPDATVLTAVATSDGVALTWVDVADETGYRVERSPDGNEWSTVGTTRHDETAFEDPDLAPATTYSYRVIATNAGGDSAPSNVASATTDSPAPIIEGGSAVGGSSGGALTADDPLAPGGALTPAADLIADIAPAADLSADVAPADTSALVQIDSATAVEGLQDPALIA